MHIGELLQEHLAYSAPLNSFQIRDLTGNLRGVAAIGSNLCGKILAQKQTTIGSGKPRKITHMREVGYQNGIDALAG